MPTNRERIEEWSLAYYLLRFYQNIMFRFYFKTEIVGLEKLSPNTTYIFAPNHQNALIDALAMLTLNHRWQPVFLARADIFKKPLVSKILTFLKIMPVYRIRDGYENLSLNDRIFLKTMDIIRNRNGLVILPEGNHDGHKRLRVLKKGIARIAFQTEDAANGELNIHIVPVGLEYSNYVRYRSRLLIRIGDPFPVKKYLELYRQNKAQAYNALIAELSDRMKQEMIHIDTEEFYDEYMLLLDLYPKQIIKEKNLSKTQNQLFYVRKKIISALDTLEQKNLTGFQKLMKQAKDLGEVLSKYKIKPKALKLEPVKVLNLLWILPLLIILSSFALYGFINHLIPIVFPFLLSKKFEDVQFHSSVRHAASLLLILIFYPVQVLVVGIASESTSLSLLYFISLPLSAVILYCWRKYFYKAMEITRVAKILINQPKEAKRINTLYNNIMAVTIETD